jgi:acyl carrier protein
MSSIHNVPVTCSPSDRIDEIIADVLMVDSRLIVDGARFYDELAADDIDMAELALAIEDEFDIEFSDDDIESINTVRDLKKLVERMMANSI